MEAVNYQSSPQLQRPVLIGGFQGWSDAGEAASTAVSFLSRSLDAQALASVDPEEFYDFQVTRPHVVVGDEGQRQIRWPQTRFAHAPLPGTYRDAVLLEGVEPSMRWRTFSKQVVDVAQQNGVELVVTMGALLAGRPHTRPIRVTGSAPDPELARELGLSPPRYQGPTGILGVLTDACRTAGIRAVTLWAWVPHYLQASTSPRAALALVQRLESLLEIEVDVSELERAAQEYDTQVNEAVSSDPELLSQIEELERQTDEDDLQRLPSGEELAEEVERFLQDRRPDDDR